MQHGPDGKIYIWAGDTHYMHVIEFPDRKGIDCTVRQRAIELPSEVFGANIYYPNYRLGPIDGSICDSLGIDNIPMAMYHYLAEDSLTPLSVTFADASYYEPTSWHWTFGDGGSSELQNPVHDFAAPGTYTVCLIAKNDYGADTLCREVMVDETSGTTNLVMLPQVQVGPNPVHDVLQVRFPAKISGIVPEIQLSDVAGRTVFRSQLPGFEQHLDVTHLPSGLYFWMVSEGGRLWKSGRVVKM
jgi:hypothetical protein